MCGEQLPGLALVESLATEAGREPAIGWGAATVRLPETTDLASLRERLADAVGVSAVATFGEIGDVSLDLSSDPPDGDALVALQQRAPDDGLRLQLLNPRDGWVAAEIAAALLYEVEVTFRRSNWCASIARFEELAFRQWRSLGELMEPGLLRVGAVELETDDFGGGREARVLVPRGDRPDVEGEEQQVWDVVYALADAQAWSLVATEVEVAGEAVLVALHRDQVASISLSPRGASGGVALWTWMSATTDANRAEATRHVLRLVTASADRLPDGYAVVALAERHRIALARENAAEVQRAISDGRSATRSGLTSARESLMSYADDTIKTAQATVVAAIGTVALVARNEEALDGWILVCIMGAAAAAVVALIISRWRRIGEIGMDVKQLGEALRPSNEPLLPDADRNELEQNVVRFNVDGRVFWTRIIMAVFGVGSIGIIVASGAWILSRSSQAPTRSPVVAVEGFVRIEDSVVQFCSELGEGEPPTCGGESWFVRGLPDAAIADATEAAEDVRWGGGVRTLVGVIDGEILDVVSLGD